MLSPNGFEELTHQGQPYRAATKRQPQLLPNDTGAEAALLGALLIDPGRMIEVGYLRPEDFFLVNHGRLYEVFSALFSEHRGYDFVTVIAALTARGYLEDAGGPGGVMALMNETPTSLGAAEYAAIVHRHSVSRQVIIRCSEIVRTAYEDTYDRPAEVLVSQALQSLADIDATAAASTGARPVKVAVNAFLDRMEAAQAGRLTGLQTGIKALDELFGGFQRNKTYILAGRPGMGKSGLALQFAHNLARRGKRPLIFSLEMAKADLVGRMVSQITRIPYEQYERGQVDNWGAIIAASQRVADLPIVIDDTPALTVETIRAVAQREMLKHEIDLIIIDHIGIVRSTVRGDNMYAKASQKADDIMALSKQLNCPVVALCQLSRGVEDRHDKRPRMADLRDTGRLEENGDVVTFLYRDVVYNPETEFPHIGEIIVAKNRGGKTGTASIYTDQATSRFLDLEYRL